MRQRDHSFSPRRPLQTVEPPKPTADGKPADGSLRQKLTNLYHLGRLIAQIWRTSRLLTLASVGLRLVRAVQPVLALYVGKLIIDEVIRLAALHASGASLEEWWTSGRLDAIIPLLALEFALVFGLDLLTRATTLVDSVLGDLHSNTVSVELMQHAARLDLRHFESPEYQDRLERARRQAAGRNGLLPQLFGQAQDMITVGTLAAGLLVYAPWLIVLLALSFLPAVWGEARFNSLSYDLARGRTPERRQLEYIRFIGASADTAIARAYMREAELVILDEPTAALDAKSEADVFARFKSLTEETTAVLISHRFSTVRMADRILVLENGGILESGTHEELLARGGRYAELFELQAAGYR